MSKAYRVDELNVLAARDFAEFYVRRARPVIVRGALKECAACSDWTFDYLRRQAGHSNVPLKKWTDQGIHLVHQPLTDYLESLELYETNCEGGRHDIEQPAYLHDLPLTALFHNADVELEAFPRDFFPSWYGADWPKFAQMFLGPSNSTTPLHFDCLLTHNLFFQVSGRKRFTLLPQEELRLCYPYNWRWYKVDIDAPDYERFPLYREARGVEVIVGPGDLLYMPPGTLHHVRSLDCALSFNVDWHTKGSAMQGLLAMARGMPLRNVYYNALIAFAMWTGVPPKRIMPYYKSYVNYVS